MAVNLVTTSVGAGVRLTPTDGSLYLIQENAIVASTNTNAIRGDGLTDVSIVIAGTVVGSSNGIFFGTPPGGDKNHVHVLSTGVLIGENFTAVILEASDSSVFNNGEIFSYGTIGVLLRGNDARLDNYGTIAAFAPAGFGQAVVVNTGAANATIVNFGDITSQIAANGTIDTRNGTGVVRIENHGAINSGGRAVVDGDAQALVFNSGIISGSVELGGGSDVLRNTGTILGDIDLGAGADWFYGANGFVDGTVSGGDGNDFLSGTAGVDSLFGNGDNDIIEGGAGGDLIDGGTGLDRADYTGSDAGVAIDLAAGLASGGHATGDQLVSIELLRGSAFNDFLFGTDGLNWLEGGAGNDALAGRGGNDNLIGGAGADQLNGGAGDDTVYYTRSTQGVNVNLVTNAGTGGDAEGDSFAGVENVVGSNQFDALFGNGVANRLVGGGGSDIISAGGGNDVVDGGTGNDQLRGGTGADTFLRRPGEGQDIVFDFEDDVDILDLSAFGFADATPATLGAANVGGNTVFSFGSGDTLTVNGILFGALQDDIVI